MSEVILQIYDRIFKRIFSLSNLAIINLINGLFGTNYPPDSAVIYPNIESVNAALKKRFADIYVSVEGNTYHLEAQMDEDESIVVRAFEYEFQRAVSGRTDNKVLHFPEPVVIYLDTEVDVPETSTLLLDFGMQGTFEYSVRNFIYQEHEVRELNQRKLIVLIPFQMLKLRKTIAKAPTKENFEWLQKLLLDDILSSIEANLTVGNITADDAHQLRELTIQLFDHVYQNYDELGGYTNMKPLLDGALELPLDKYRMRIDELEEKTSTLQEEANSYKEEANTYKEEANAYKEKANALEEEIQRLQELLEQKEK